MELTPGDNQELSQCAGGLALPQMSHSFEVLVMLRTGQSDWFIEMMAVGADSTDCLPISILFLTNNLVVFGKNTDST